MNSEQFSLKQLKLLDCSGSPARLKSILIHISPEIEVFQEDSIQLDEEFQSLRLNFLRLKELTWNGSNIIGKAVNLQVNYLF